MVVIFQSEKALRQLTDRGHVITFRVKKRKRIGNDWVTDKRGGQKIVDVVVSEPKEVNVTKLAPYVRLSGFPSMPDWWIEIQRLNGGKLPKTGLLYHVRLRCERDGWKETY